MERSNLIQKQKVYSFLLHNSCSRWMVAEGLDIPLQNVCRYVDELRTQGRLWVVKKAVCSISGRFVEFVSCNPDLRDKSQLQLFGGGQGD